MRKKEVFGWLMYDFANSAFATTILAVILPLYFVRYVAPTKEISVCLFGFKFSSKASAIWAYTVSFSTLLVAISAPVLGAIADISHTRKKFLFVFCYLGCIFTGLLYFVEKGDYLLAMLLFALANICFAASNVFYNAFLSQITTEADLDWISGKGFSYGYLGGGILLLLNLLMIMKYDSFGFTSRVMAIRACFLTVAIWWAIFAIPTFCFLKEEKTIGEKKHFAGFLSFFQAFKKIANFKEMLKFLIAFLIYNEGVQTVIATASVFATVELVLSETNLIGALLFVQFIGIPCTLIWGWMAQKIGTKKVLLIILSLWLCIIFYAYFMKTPVEFWILGAMVGFILGGTQALSRSLYASFVPKEHSAEFFGFYTISHKFASIVGPFGFGLIYDITGSLRYSILFIAVFFVLGFIILSTVNLKQKQNGHQV